MSFRVASKEAKKSKHKQHKLGAVIEKNGRVLSTGYNQLRPSAYLNTPTLHAEASAILKLLKERRLHDLLNSDLYVIRYTRGGSVGCSRPCPDCLRLCMAVGIRRVHYIGSDNHTQTLKL